MEVIKLVMGKRYLFYFLFVFMFLTSFLGLEETLAQDNSVESTPVSLIQLIANPSEYHEKSIRVIGYCCLEFEGDVLYLHREDFEQGITKNAVWITVEGLKSKRRFDLNNRYVIVEGIFDSQDKGHLELFSGCIKEIKRIEKWRSRDELRKTHKNKCNKEK